MITDPESLLPVYLSDTSQLQESRLGLPKDCLYTRHCETNPFRRIA
ncbi:hypothetical protein FHR87_000198 [Azomonas macrocytogenes]|uniref:Uncharacterized protein n=1 Tax=Azomonas macrocytogenes TaxID=69962 RepID=A0A839SY49_AZOMA|nr:hypothetical protein [Azomonas macrocytogenes]